MDFHLLEKVISKVFNGIVDKVMIHIFYGLSIEDDDITVMDGENEKVTNLNLFLNLEGNEGSTSLTINVPIGINVRYVGSIGNIGKVQVKLQVTSFIF